MTLAANVLNAVGGSPALDRPDFIARYPTYLLHSVNASWCRSRRSRRTRSRPS
jgi:hypothetical protein